MLGDGLGTEIGQKEHNWNWIRSGLGDMNGTFGGHLGIDMEGRHVSLHQGNSVT